MTVEVDVTRKAVEIVWDTKVATGATVNIKATNDDDISTRDALKNDGRATLTFPAGYHGTSKITVLGSAGGCDKGTIKV